MRLGLLFSCAVIGLTLTSASWVKKAFEGKIEYKITYQNVPAEMEGFESMLPQKMLIYFKGSKIRLEQSMGMAGNQIVLTDNETKESNILMDMLGQKINVFITKEEVEEAEKTMVKPQITYLEDKKEILGYKCKKAKVKNGDNETIVFYTEQLKIKHKDFSDLDGYPLQYTIDQDGMMITMTASVVQKEEVSDQLFEVPDGYQKMSMEELQQMTGGNN